MPRRWRPRSRACPGARGRAVVLDRRGPRGRELRRPVRDHPGGVGVEEVVRAAQACRESAAGAAGVCPRPGRGGRAHGGAGAADGRARVAGVAFGRNPRDPAAGAGGGGARPRRPPPRGSRHPRPLRPRPRDRRARARAGRTEASTRRICRGGRSRAPGRAEPWLAPGRRVGHRPGRLAGGARSPPGPPHHDRGLETARSAPRPPHPRQHRRGAARPGHAPHLHHRRRLPRARLPLGARPRRPPAPGTRRPWSFSIGSGST